MLPYLLLEMLSNQFLKSLSSSCGGRRIFILTPLSHASTYQFYSSSHRKWSAEIHFLKNDHFDQFRFFTDRIRYASSMKLNPPHFLRIPKVLSSTQKLCHNKSYVVKLTPARLLPSELHSYVAEMNAILLT